MIPSDFHQYKIRLETFFFFDLYMHISFIFMFPPHLIEWNAARIARNNIFRTLCAGTVGDFEGTQARWETLQCQKCKYKSSQCRFIGDRLSYDR